MIVSQKVLKILSKGEIMLFIKIAVNNNNTWTSSKIISQTEQPRLYLVANKRDTFKCTKRPSL